MYADNDGRFPEDTPVLTRYPLNDDQDRENWPWLPGTVIGQCHGPTAEWHLVIDGGEDLAETDPDHPGEYLYPTCFRTAEEIRLIHEAPVLNAAATAHLPAHAEVRT
jgi:hypothetical protein